MNKESFLDLLDRYQHGNCTENEKRFVAKWYASLNEDDQASLSSTELSSMSRRVLEHLYVGIQQPELRSHKLRTYKISLAAAVAMAMICAFLYAYNYNNAERAFKNKITGTELLHKTNTTASSITITLSDKSQVTLQPKASLTYPAVFNGLKRLVYLKGDAFFSVAKNRQKPFYVYNKTLKVKVLGTSFFVNEAKAQVAVRTGKVQVNENPGRSLFTLPGTKKAPEVVLTPNQEAILNDTQHQIRKSLVAQPIPLSVAYHRTATEDFNFSETRLSQVFEVLSKAYGINILIENSKTQECTFTGDLENKGLYEQLNLICATVSGTYVIKGTSIYVQAKTCN
ncbi:FecR family protein [Pedobacter sp. MC2016-14]|uniref:FecR family protein n=1 Tax=Pedobacter sp. MC2016-14 TaxID=2897327 RepID=UPI001E5FD1D7|nr:FecR family protein [Pedobacter sp. MC2016-14]MCD0486627.1 FecR family protein [Pedobacter sp. MC2016-14]